MEKQDLNLDYIKLTPELIETVNELQTGGTIGLSKGTDDSYFNNSSLKNRIDEITELSDFLVYVYSDSPELFNVDQFSKFLINLRYFKTILNGLAAPEPVKQPTI